MSWDLKVVIGSDFLLCWGSEFQSLGAEQLKAWAPMVLRREVGMVSCPAEVEQREQEEVYSWRRLKR